MWNSSNSGIATASLRPRTRSCSLPLVIALCVPGLQRGRRVAHERIREDVAHAVRGGAALEGELQVWVAAVQRFEESRSSAQADDSGQIRLQWQRQVATVVEEAGGGPCQAALACCTLTCLRQRMSLHAHLQAHTMHNAPRTCTPVFTWSEILILDATLVHLAHQLLVQLIASHCDKHRRSRRTFCALTSRPSSKMQVLHVRGICRGLGLSFRAATTLEEQGNMLQLQLVPPALIVNAQGSSHQ